MAHAYPRFRPMVDLLENRFVLNNFGYAASSTTFENIDLELGQTGVFVIDPGADDNTDTLTNFGTNTFRFYNTTYTGNNSIFVSTNGFIAFGTNPGNGWFVNQDLSSQLTNAMLAPHWDDLYGVGATDMVLGRYDDLNSDGTPDRLIIEWNRAEQFNLPAGQNITFQAILYINTGNTPGKIVYNYVDTIFGTPGYDNGGSATVGIKNDNAAAGGADRELVWFNGAGQIMPTSGSAIQIIVQGSHISGTKFQDLNGNGVQDAGENGLQGWTFFLDANNNGILDSGEVSTTTDASGRFNFDTPEISPGPGTYRVREVQRPGWRQTTANPPPIVVPPTGVNVSGLLFGNQRVATAVTGTDAGGPPRVHVYRAATGDQELFNFYAYEFTYTGGVRVATADLTGDRLPDIITAPGAGRPAEVRVFNGNNPLTGPIISFFPFGTTYTGGLFIAAADVTGDGIADLIIGSGTSHVNEVRIWNGATRQFLPADIFPYESTYRNGVHVAAADMNRDGRAEVITAPANGRSPQVRIFNLRFNASTGGDSPLLLRTIMAYGSTYTGGVWIDADTNRIVTGPGTASNPEVHVYNGATGVQTGSFLAYSPSQAPNGVRVALVDMNGDGVNDIMTGLAPIAQPLVRYFDGVTLTEIVELGFWCYEPNWTGGVFVGGSH